MAIDEGELKLPQYVTCAAIAVGALLILVDYIWGGGMTAIYAFVTYTMIAAFSLRTGDNLATCFALASATTILGLFEGLCLYDIHVRLPREGGGANIGLGILFMALPFMLAFFMWIAFLMGWAIQTGMGRQRIKEHQ